MLNDMMKTMFAEKFIAQLLEPAPVYSNETMRGLFDKLAHSSIMRLSSNSMDKLYDLMTMGVKQQIMNCRCADEILATSNNHWLTLKALTKSSEARNCLSKAFNAIHDFYSTLASFEMHAVRNTILNFFRGRRVKVSLFLNEGLQFQDGSFAIHTNGPVPLGSQVPGIIRYFDKTRSRLVVRKDQFPSALFGVEEAWPAQHPFHALLPFGKRLARSTDLGSNLYTTDRSKKDKSSGSGEEGDGEGPSAEAAPGPKRTVELDMLATMVVGESGKADGPSTMAAVFSDEVQWDESAEGEDSTQSAIAGATMIIKQGAETIADKYKNLMVAEDESGTVDDGDDDLLDLMDAAAVA